MINHLKTHKYLFKGIDTIVYFNIFFFIGAGLTVINQTLEVALIMISLGLFNGIFLYVSFRTRHQLHLKMMDEIVKEAEVEEVAQKEGNSDFIQMKQEMLENRLYAYIKNEFPDAKFIRNAYIPKQDNTFSEIDLLMVDKTGIYIVEAKNFAGTITGNWTEDDKLIIKHPGGSSYDFFNPVKQNTKHYKNLKNATGLDSHYFRSLIVLGDHTIFDFKTVPNFSRVCQVKHACNQIRYLAKQNPVNITQHEVELIYDTLQKYVSKTDEKTIVHLNNITSYRTNK